MKTKKNILEKSETENEKQNETSFYRLIFVGDKEVGKTEIINKYNNKIFQEEYFPTYSVDFQIKTLKIRGKLINIHCIDTQGSSDFSQDTGNLFIQKSDAFIYVFDITSRESFNNLSYYYEIIKLALTDSQKMLREKIVYLVGNKCDLTTYRQINESEGRLEATKYKAKYIEVSAKTGLNIDKLFDYVIQDIAKKEQDSTSFDSGGGIIHKNIFNNNKNINNTNNINNNINEININNNNLNNINTNNNTYNNSITYNNINTNTNLIENEKSGLHYDNSSYYLKSNMSINNNNNYLVKNINNPEVNRNKEEFRDSNFFSNKYTKKCQIF